MERIERLAKEALVRRGVHFLLIITLGLLAYSNTFNVPFQWDEYDYITQNPIVKDASYFIHPSKAQGLRQYDSLINRFIGYLTFALNYKIHGLSVTGYHIVNIAIHLINAFLVYFLVILTFKTPNLKESSLKEKSPYIALFSALIFVSHPVQTEAVTYIFQRLASLTALFCLSSLVLYITWRLRQDTAEHVFPLKGILFYFFTLLSLVFAMKTKENAFMFPAIIALYEFFLFKGAVKKRILFLVPILLTMLIIPLSLIGIDRPLGEMIGGLRPDEVGFKGISGKDYLITQFGVIATYIRLLFMPINQNLAYDYPVYKSLTDVLLPIVLHVSLIGLAVYLFKRNRLVSFGILWFYIALLVESSLIPLPMLINEYRVYLPSVGMMVAVTAIADSFFNKKTFVVVFMVAALLLSYLAYERNNVWRSEISLWEDVVRKSPKIARGHNNLGHSYCNKGFVEKGLEHYETAMRLAPDYYDAQNNAANAYLAKGLFDRAIEHYGIALMIKPDSSETEYNIGSAYHSQGRLDAAIGHYQRAIDLKPDFVEAFNNIGVAYNANGLFDKAVEVFQKALELAPENAATHYNIGNSYLRKGLFDKAIYHYQAALAIRPDFKEAQNNLSDAYNLRR